MTEPVLAGRALVEQIEATAPGDERVALWWLGQSGYVIRWRDTVVLVDPYLSDHLATKYAGSEKPHDRLTRAPLAPDEVTFCDLLLATHRHSDHLDPGTVPGLLAASPEALLVLPAAHADYAVETIGVPEERLVPIDDGERFTHRDVTVHAVPAAHERIELDRHGRMLCLGYVIECGGVSLYQAGDTIPYREQVELLRGYSPQVMLLGINGRGARLQALGTPGNLTIAEAACLASAVGAEVVIPNHYGMFAFNTADPRRFVDHVREHYEELQPVVLQPGARWLYPPNGG